MARKLLTAFAGAVALALALMGCSSGSEDAVPAKPPKAEKQVVQEVVVEEETELAAGGTLSNREACELFTSASLEALGDVDTENYQTLIDAEMVLYDGIKEAGERSADPLFRERAEAAYEAGIAKAELDYRLHVEGDTSLDLDELFEVNEDFSEAYVKLLELCSK